MFSVVIPLFNNYEIIANAIKSCDSELIKEIIIVDDTPEESREVIKDVCLSNQIEITIILNRQNRGVTFSRNRGYFLSKSNFVIFLDSDDTLIPDNLIAARNFILSSNTDCAFFRTKSNGIVNSDTTVKVNGCWYDLLRFANKGEKLVVVKNIKNKKPFYGALRGHELAGLLNFSQKNSLTLGWSDLVLRDYNTEGDSDSLSSLRLSKARASLISKGHYKVSYLLIQNFKLINSLKYFLKAKYYARF